MRLFKRISALFICVIMLLSLTLPLVSCDETSGGSVTELYVYNWGEYISDG